MAVSAVFFLLAICLFPWGLKGSLVELPVVMGDGTPEMLPLNVGQTVELAVYDFLVANPTARPYREQLIDSLRKTAMASGAIPQLSVPIARQPNKPPIFTVHVYSGENPLAKAASTAEKHTAVAAYTLAVASVPVHRRRHPQRPPSPTQAGLGPEEVSAVVDVVRRQGQRLRLLPVFQLPLVLRGENAGTVNVYRGDSVREVAKAHAAKMGVDDALADEVVEFVVSVAKRRRVEPLLSLKVEVTVKETRRTKDTTVQVFEGEDIDFVVAQYAELYDLPPANRTKLSKFLVDAARNKRLLPVTVVPVSGPRGSPVDIPVFSGDSPMAAVARVAQEMERREGGPSGGAGGSGGGGAEWREAAVRVVDRAAVAQKLRWAAQAVVGVQGEEHKVQLWFGESAEEKARGFAERVGLGAAEREAVAAELRRQAEAVGAVPVVWERVNAGSAPALFELFHGEDVGRRAADFVAAQGWDEVYGGVLARRAKELAMSKGALPVVALGGTVRGKPFEVRVYAGDDAEEVLGRFAERYKLPAADSKFLVDSLAAKMQARIDAVKS